MCREGEGGARASDGGVDPLSRRSRLLGSILPPLSADTLARRKLIFAYGYVGDTLGNPMVPNLGDSQGALKAYGQMADEARSLYNADPADARAVGDYGSALLKLGIATPKAEHLRKETLTASYALLQRAAGSNPQNRTIANNLISAESELGYYQAAIAEGEKALNDAPDEGIIVRSLALAVRPLAEAQARKGQRAEALATLDHSLRWAARMDSAVPPTAGDVPATAIAWQAAGSVYAILAGSEAVKSGVPTVRHRAHGTNGPWLSGGRWNMIKPFFLSMPPT